VVCVETTTGKEVWRRNFRTDWGGKEGGNWGCSESPLVDGDRVVVTPGGRQATMVALDRKTGKEIWKGLASGNPGAGHSSVVIATVGGVKQYINLTGNSVVAFDAKDGKFLWKYGDDQMHFGRNTANVPTCIVKGDHVFCSAGYGRGGALLRMVPDNGSVQVQEVWFEQKLNNKHGGWVLVGEHLYGDRDESGRPQCAELKTGKVVWEKNQRTTGSGSASIAYADGRLYIRYTNGVMTLAAASPKSFSEISSFRIPNVSQPSWTHPVVWDGKLFLREQDDLYCYDVKQK
jgi:outer membrane protein assembly factor BamB